MKWVALCACAAVTLFARPSPAEEALDLVSLMSIEVTSASKKSQTIAQAPAVIDTISAAEIREKGFTSVAQALRSLPGFLVTTDHVVPNVAVRGIHGGFRASSRILKVMVNGAPIAFRSTSENLLGPELIPIEAVAAIEVIRGPASALYGANAFLGIVNIITARGENAEGVAVEGSYGMFNTTDNSIAVGVSVLHLFVSTLEASAELMMGEKWSLVAIGGIGLIEIPKHDVHPEADATRLTVGGQARKYLTGNSQMGGYVAPEVLVFVDGSDQDDAEGIFAELGLVFGYKETWEDGFMVDLAVGLAGSTGPERKKGDTPLQLVGNLNLGYAF